MSKARLIKRLQWYYPTEKFHTFFTFPLLLLYLIFTNPINDILFVSYGLLVCIVILYQGQFCWKLKLDSLLGKKLEQEKNIQFFQKSKKTNFLLFLPMPFIFCIQFYLNEWNIKSNMFLWGILANVFAILEHINYYHIQLMVDNKYDIDYLKKNKRLKKASLAKDLIENRI